MKSKNIIYSAFAFSTCLAAAALFSGCSGSSSDGEAEEAPDTAIKRPATAVAGNLLSNTGEVVDADVLNDTELTAFYFSASWCPPCRAFTPQLVKFAEKNKDQLSVVLISQDRSPEGQQKYLDDYKMPFYALRYNSAPVAELSNAFSVRFIPTLVVVDRNGDVVTTDGVAAVRNDPQRAMQNWLASTR